MAQHFFISHFHGKNLQSEKEREREDNPRKQRPIISFSQFRHLHIKQPKNTPEVESYTVHYIAVHEVQTIPINYQHLLGLHTDLSLLSYTTPHHNATALVFSTIMNSTTT